MVHEDRLLKIGFIAIIVISLGICIWIAPELLEMLQWSFNDARD